MTYKILQSTDKDVLVALVNKLIGQGYTPIGGVVLEHYDTHVDYSISSGRLRKFTPKYNYIQTMLSSPKPEKLEIL